MRYKQYLGNIHRYDTEYLLRGQMQAESLNQDPSDILFITTIHIHWYRLVRVEDSMVSDTRNPVVDVPTHLAIHSIDIFVIRGSNHRFKISGNSVYSLAHDTSAFPSTRCRTKA